jgi:uncharacterized protein with HEPN domain
MAAPRDPRIVLEQMLEAILDIEQITAGRTFEAYAADRPRWSAALRSSRKPRADCHPTSRIVIPQFPGRRSRVSAISCGTNDITLWHAATVDLLPLKTAVEALLREIEATP